MRVVGCDEKNKKEIAVYQSGDRGIYFCDKRSRKNGVITAETKCANDEAAAAGRFAGTVSVLRHWTRVSVSGRVFGIESEIGTGGSRYEFEIHNR